MTKSLLRRLSIPGETEWIIAIAIISGRCLQFPLVVLALPVLLGLALRARQRSHSTGPLTGVT